MGGCDSSGRTRDVARRKAAPDPPCTMVGVADRYYRKAFSCKGTEQDQVDTHTPYPIPHTLMSTIAELDNTVKKLRKNV